MISTHIWYTKFYVHPVTIVICLFYALAFDLSFV